MKRRWDRKPCGCVKANLPAVGKLSIRCSRHRGKPSKRILAYFDENGLVRREDATR